MSPVDHPDSWYAATANPAPAFGQLNGAQRADVCVIGAGFTGLSAALELAERGYDVCVLEARRVGWGASGRNGGQLIGGLSGEARLARALGPAGEDLLWELRWAGHALIRERVRRYAIDCDLKTGHADVATRSRHVRRFERERDWLARRGFEPDVELLSARETQELLGTRAYTGALVNMGNEHLHPLNLCLGEAAAAARAGARIFEGSPVLRIEPGSRPRVLTATGDVSANAIVLAGNAYHALEGSLADRMLPFSSFIIATEPLSSAVAAEINPRDIAVCDSDFVLEYFRLSRDRRLLFGGRCEYAGSDPLRIRRELFPRMLAVYPQLRDVGIDHAWGGRIGIPFNRVPQLGRLRGNVYYAQGYSGHGVNVSHLAGKLVADAIAGDSERFDAFARCRSPRIPGVRLAALPLVRLAVAWYRLRDRLG